MMLEASAYHLNGQTTRLTKPKSLLVRKLINPTLFVVILGMHFSFAQL